MPFNIFTLFRKRSGVSQSYAAVPPPPAVVVTGMTNIIEAITKKHKAIGIDVNTPAMLTDIARFEQQIGFSLPEDFKAFYTICNGFGCTESIFNMTPLEEIINCENDDGLKGFYFAEYMIEADNWGLRFTAEKKYEIFNGYYPTVTMTSSLEEFLDRFLLGDVFEKDGLYEWRDEVEIGLAKK